MQSQLPYIIYVHSILRYFILLFALIVFIQSMIGMMGKKRFKDVNRKMALLLLIFCDLQLVLGLLLYYFRVIGIGLLNSGMVMKDPYIRFYAVEHSVGMIVAIILVHISYATAKKTMNDEKKFKKIFWCVLAALLIIFAMIPWEGKQIVGRPNIPVLNKS